MTPNLLHPTLFNPFIAWTDLAMKATEMVVSSGQLIGERVDEIARASANASPPDFKQLTLLGGDEVKTATESSFDMMTRMQSASFQLMARAWQQWFTSLGALSALTGSRTFGEALSRQDRLFKSLIQSDSRLLRPSDDAAHVEIASPKARQGTSRAHAKRHTAVSKTRVATSRR